MTADEFTPKLGSWNGGTHHGRSLKARRKDIVYHVVTDNQSLTSSDLLPLVDQATKRFGIPRLTLPKLQRLLVEMQEADELKSQQAHIKWRRWETT